MIPLERIQMVNLSSAKPGSVLLRRARGTFGPQLVAKLNDTPIFVHLDNGERGFHIWQPSNSEKEYICAGPARFLVDPNSAFTSLEARPSEGDLMLSDGKQGLVAHWQHSTVYVGLDGSQLGEPQWSDFVGFRSWSVEVDGGRPDVPLTVFTRNAPD